MSWCDKLASVPTAGFTLDWHFGTNNAILEGVSPILDQLVKDDKPQFNVNQPDSFSTTFVTEEGFQYSVEPSKVVVGFQHRMRAKAVSGGHPVMEMLSHPRPYTVLLPAVCQKLIETALLVPHASSRKIRRVGIVSTTFVDIEEVPPGIKRFITYMGKPWQQELPSFNLQIVVDLPADENSKDQKWTDKCVHTLTKPENPEDLVTVVLDWQRNYTEGQPITSDSMKKITRFAEQAALEYFENLAEGSRFYDETAS